MERTRKISMQTLAIAILSVLLVASLLMSATGAWFTDGAGDTDDGYLLGTIEIADIDAGFAYTIGEDSGEVFMPGDLITIDFDVQNTGSADMWVRFKLTAVGEGAFDGAASEESIDDYIYNEDDSYFYRTTVLQSGALLENIVFDFEIPWDLADDFQGDPISFALVVEAVQASNNGTEPDGEGAYVSQNYETVLWNGLLPVWGE